MNPISVVIPLLNEQETLFELVRRIDASCDGELCEIVFIDDGSTDGSWQAIEKLAQARGSVRALRFRRNFGKAAALAAGFAEATGKIIITMDADLQDDPKEIPRMLAKLGEGYDVVSGWKQHRFDPWHKRWPSLVFNAILRYFSKIPLHDFNCGFKAYRREVLEEIDLYGEMHRFVPVLAAARGFKVAEITVEHHPREFGSSKYGWSRIPKGFLDLATVVFLTRFRYRPQHLLGGLGGAIFFVGAFMLSLLICIWGWTRLAGYENPLHLHERASFFVSILLIVVGIQAFATGLIAELLVANAQPARRVYSIAARVDPPS
ncbi:MAG: glycosyltransferase family 2 protein [Pirellula sp.]|jgi:dolichol-phosphate mannosyltransferase|nr:glycosyltransferase family 2 protein [Pirellula sp.]